MVLADGCRQHLFAKVGVLLDFEHLDQSFSLEYIDAHGGDVGLGFGFFRAEAEGLGVHLTGFQQISCWLFLEIDDATVLAKLEQAKTRGHFFFTGEHRQRHIGPNLPVMLDEGAVVHAVEVIPR
jgi:hypothetical protein